MIFYEFHLFQTGIISYRISISQHAVLTMEILSALNFYAVTHREETFRSIHNTECVSYVGYMLTAKQIQQILNEL